MHRVKNCISVLLVKRKRRSIKGAEQRAITFLILAVLSAVLARKGTIYHI